MRRKFVSIVLLILLIVITLIGITACTKDKQDKLVGVWISVAEDNEHYPFVEKTETWRVYVNYYALITESELKDSDNLVFKSYMIYENSGKFVEHTSSKIIRNPQKEGVYYMSTKFVDNDTAGSSYKITMQDDDTILVTDDEDAFSKYIFRRTTMTLEEFKTTYGKAE